MAGEILSQRRCKSPAGSTGTVGDYYRDFAILFCYDLLLLEIILNCNDGCFSVAICTGSTSLIVGMNHSEWSENLKK